MYYKDKTERLVVRVSKEQMEHLDYLADLTQISKSDIIRGYNDKSLGAKVLHENRKTNKHCKF